MIRKIKKRGETEILENVVIIPKYGLSSLLLMKAVPVIWVGND
jgi:hypothetical protein